MELNRGEIFIFHLLINYLLTLVRATGDCISLTERTDQSIPQGKLGDLGKRWRPDGCAPLFFFARAELHERL